MECYIPARRAKVAITVHDLHALEPHLPWSNTPEHVTFCNRWRMKFKPMVRHTNLFLAVSEFTKSRMVDLLDISAERIAVVGNGVDDFFFDPPNLATQKELAIHGNRPYIIVTGGLTRKKGAQYTLQVAEHLARLVPDIRVVVTGFSNDAVAEHSARQLPNVVLAGHVDDELYHALLGRARCLLFLSRYEGFGIPILEAMAMGVPVIASQFASIPEVVGDAGVLVDVDDPEAIALMIRDICQSPGSSDEVVARGRMKAEQWRWKACVARLRSALMERM
jgi:glycosyltransferase involved in cell wall biosynthesis